MTPDWTRWSTVLHSATPRYRSPFQRISGTARPVTVAAKTSRVAARMVACARRTALAAAAGAVGISADDDGPCRGAAAAGAVETARRSRPHAGRDRRSRPRARRDRVPYRRPLPRRRRTGVVEASARDQRPSSPLATDLPHVTPCASDGRARRATIPLARRVRRVARARVFFDHETASPRR